MWEDSEQRSVENPFTRWVDGMSFAPYSLEKGVIDVDDIERIYSGDLFFREGRNGYKLSVTYTFELVEEANPTLVSQALIRVLESTPVNWIYDR